ncbi:UNVERIFIED_ORG: terminase [Clostridium botulinum]
MSVNTNRILKGNSGNVWFNGKLLATVKKIEAKITGDFEDDNFCGDSSTYSIYNGWSGSGTLSMEKIDSAIWSIMCDAYKSGIMPTIKIITSLTDKVTGKSERASIEDIVITEFMLANFEAKTKVVEDFPFKFSNYEKLEAIA